MYYWLTDQSCDSAHIRRRRDKVVSVYPLALNSDEQVAGLYLSAIYCNARQHHIGVCARYKLATAALCKISG